MTLKYGKTGEKHRRWRNEWAELIKLHCPNGKRSRRPKGIENMLRMYLLQYWFMLSV